MSQHNTDEDDIKRNYVKPYGGKHPVPTVQGYREHRRELEERYGGRTSLRSSKKGDSRTKRALTSAKTILKGEDDGSAEHDPYPVSNHNDEQRLRQQGGGRLKDAGDSSEGQPKDRDSKNKKQPEKSATEQAAGTIDPRAKRKAMKYATRGAVDKLLTPLRTCPSSSMTELTRTCGLPLKTIPPWFAPRTATGLSGASKGRQELDQEQAELQRSYNGLLRTFPPPSFEQVEQNLSSIYMSALTMALCTILGLAAVAMATSAAWPSSNTSTRSKYILSAGMLAILLGAGAAVVYATRGWLKKKASAIWEDETWDALEREEQELLESDAELPESVQWLNSLFTSVWPLINPDLFASLVDTLEDVMQASLPKIVRMVSIDDLGQGNEAIRILGIKWLPTGAASQAVDDKGNLKTPDEKAENDRTDPGKGEQDQSVNDGGEEGENHASHQTAEEKKDQQREQEAIRSGMEAEEGDFVNLELALAYRARPSGKSIKSRAKNAHLYLKFYLPGGIAVPVWVELRGIIGIMRLRLQLTPDPPFFSVCTFTFLGQPKADLSCVPLSKHAFNLMDIPLISGFVQSAIDAALAEYVAPKSMTLNLKDMLMGDDFKKDTSTKGVVWIFIKRARDFKQGDGGVGPMKGASDSYVSVSWAKFGKPVASTRVIEAQQEPDWHEWANILVSVEEINASEKLKLQLWDSDKWTADDDLGRVEVDLRELMHSPETKNKMCDREDRFKGADAEEDMPGILSWSVGFFEKTRITDQQLRQQNVNKNIRSKEQLKQHVSDQAQRKLREAEMDGEHDNELQSQKVRDYKQMEDDLIISAPPSQDHPSGVLSIQIHNITGLEVQRLSKQKTEDDYLEAEDEEGANLPDSYCTIILNQRKVYRTRTKPKNAKPFFNAGTERFVKDWSTCEVIVSVRDSREREDDALLGVVYLPLRKLFEKRSQVMETYPLAGGIGYGRARISMVWRSVELQLPPNLRGWDYGTLEIKGAVRQKGPLQNSIGSDRIKLRTNLSRTKMRPQDGQWQPKRRGRNDSVFLAVCQRYSSALVIEFRRSTIGPDKTPAFGVLWLSDLVDEEEETKTIKIWKGGKDNVKRAESCCDYAGSNDGEQPLGQLEVVMKFWRGLSGYHKSHASKSENNEVRSVMECLDTINDEGMDNMWSDEEDTSDSDEGTEKESESGPRPTGAKDESKPEDETPEDAQTRKKLQTHTNQGDSSFENSDLESGESGGFSKIKAPFSKVQEALSSTTDKATGNPDIKDDGSRGLRAQVQDYKQNHKQLHRKHRGIMQWKSVRTLDWAGGKMKRAQGRIGDLFEHSEKGQGVETEV